MGEEVTAANETVEDVDTAAAAAAAVEEVVVVAEEEEDLEDVERERIGNMYW